MRMSRCVTEVKEQMDKQRRRRGRIVAPGVSWGLKSKLTRPSPRSGRQIDLSFFINKVTSFLSPPLGLRFFFEP